MLNCTQLNLKESVMLALKIPGIKNFMNGMLGGTLFDPFLTVEGNLVTSVTYTIDGHINMDYFPEEDRNEEKHPYAFQPWSDTKVVVYDLIKGSNVPLYMRFMLELKPEKAAEMLKNASPETDFSFVKALILNIKYENGAITITTGTSYSTFVMNHDADIIWDKSIQKYLSGKGIDFELL